MLSFIYPIGSGGADHAILYPIFLCVSLLHNLRKRLRYRFRVSPRRTVVMTTIGCSMPIFNSLRREFSAFVPSRRDSCNLIVLFYGEKVREIREVGIDFPCGRVE